MRLSRFKVLWQDKSVHGDGEIEPSERRFRTWVLAIAALVGPPLVFFVYYRLMFTGLFIMDSLDYAQLGRNLSHGSFTTYVLRPLGLPVDGPGVHNAARVPDLIHGPLYPLILAMAFGVAGAKDSVVAWVSGLFYLLTIPLVYRLAVKVFGRAVALITVLVFTFNALMLEYAYSGLPLTLMIFLSTWLLLVMYNLAAYVRDHETDRNLKVPKGQLALAGILLGLLYLTDTIFLWFAPVAAGWLFWLFGNVQSANGGSKRFQAVLRFALPFVILALPWMFRNLRLGTNPFFGLRMYEVWMNTKDYPEYTAYQLMPGELISGVGLFKSVTSKIMLGVGRIIQGFPQISASWILAFFLPSLLFKFTDPAAHRLRQVMMLLFLSLMVGMLLFGIQMPLFVTTVPTMLAFAVAYLLYLVRQSQMRRSSITVTAVLLAIAVVLPLANVVLGDRLDPRLKPPNIKNEEAAARGLAKITAKAETAFSDRPQIVAWYANRPAIYIPLNDTKIKDLRKRYEKARYLFLTEDVVRMDEAWRPIYMGVAQWNERCAAARNAGQPLPAPPSIYNAPETNQPWHSLNGFVAQPPVKGGKRVAVMMSTGPFPDATQSADVRTP